MFERGLTPQRIATLCRVDVRRIHRAVTKQIQQDSRYLNRCLLLHDQPVYQPPAPPAPSTPTERWAASYVAIAGHVLRTRSLPSQKGGEQSRALYKWLQHQRVLHAAGKLDEHRLDALDKLGPWQGMRRGAPDDHWHRRLGEVAAFLEEHGHLPAYTEGRDDTERRLASWLGRQRTWARRGELKPDRAERLDATLPCWGSLSHA